MIDSHNNNRFDKFWKYMLKGLNLLLAIFGLIFLILCICISLRYLFNQQKVIEYVDYAFKPPGLLEEKDGQTGGKNEQEEGYAEDRQDSTVDGDTPEEPSGEARKGNGQRPPAEGGLQPEGKSSEVQTQLLTTQIALNKTSNILQMTGILLMLVVFIVTASGVVFALLGLKFIGRILELQKLADDTKRQKLDAAQLTLHSVPEMMHTQQVPDRYRRVLKEFSKLSYDEGLRKLIEQNPQYQYIDFGAALYQIAGREYPKAIETLKRISANISIDDEYLLGEARFKLAMTYRGERKYENAWEISSMLKGERKYLIDFSKAVALFAHVQRWRSFKVLKEKIKAGVFAYAWNDIEGDNLLPPSLEECVTSKDNADWVKEVGVLLNLLAYITITFKEAADTYYDMPMMQFFAAEILGFMYEHLYLGINDESLSDEEWQIFWEKLWEKLQKEQKDKKEKKDKKKGPIKHVLLLLNDYAHHAIEQSKVLLPAQTDENIKANWYYCVALMNYFEGLAYRFKNGKEKDSYVPPPNGNNEGEGEAKVGPKENGEELGGTEVTHQDNGNINTGEIQKDGGERHNADDVEGDKSKKKPSSEEHQDNYNIRIGNRIKEDFKRNIKLADHYADYPEWIYSEITQSDVSKAEFKDQILKLKEKFGELVKDLSPID